MKTQVAKFISFRCVAKLSECTAPHRSAPPEWERKEMVRHRDAANGEKNRSEESVARQPMSDATRCDVGVTESARSDGGLRRGGGVRLAAESRQTTKRCRFISLLTPIFSHYIKQY